jgi:cellulose synthase/poly-beta-1,6-N-acetylglucosamine synthase-like glycosyltransferase
LPELHHVAGGDAAEPFAREEENGRDMALRLDVPFVAVIPRSPRRRADPGSAAIDAARAYHDADGRLYLAPEREKLEAIATWLENHPELRDRLAISTPGAIRTALLDMDNSASAEAAANALANSHPALSARRVLSRGQAIVGFVLLAGLAACLVRAWHTTLLVLNLAMGSLFFGMAVLRLIAVARLARFGPRTSPPISLANDDALPTYTVLVPLYGEARIVADLVHALQSLDWPPDKLDVKLILEADDEETRRVAERAIEGTPFEIVVVPPVAPRTKPRALVFALGFARGELVTVYDAEDRPHPMQLREAHAAFSRAGPELACVQAPLLIDNLKAGALARYFALEYAALFDGLLPALAALHMPLPLGGTSNHFRREALENAGGWDPYNVTEDADLGMRLARFGYRCDTISRPTWEEAPVTPHAWLAQRTRWFKGWLQTFLVHTRQPVVLVRQLGLRSTIGFLLVGIGMLASAIIHPVYVANVIITAFDPLALWSDGGVFSAAVVGFNLFNLVVGYYAAIRLSWRTMQLRNRRRPTLALATLPLYWLLMSVACLLAIGQLVRRPHYWAKTPHRGRSGRARIPEPARERRGNLHDGAD